MKIVPNQKLIQVNKMKIEKGDNFLYSNLEAIGQASRNLEKLASFKLYIYISSNKDKYEFALSNKDFCEWSGVRQDCIYISSKRID